MSVRVGNLIFRDWVSLELPGGWTDTFIFRMAPTAGLPPADYAGVIRALALPLRKLRPHASLWVQVDCKPAEEGCRAAGQLPGEQPAEQGVPTAGLTMEAASWYRAEVRYALRGLRLPVAVTGDSTRPQLWDFSFFPRVDPRPYPRPPAAVPYLKEEDFRPSELACLRVLARSDCAYTAEVASLADLSKTGARAALRRLAEHRLVALEDSGKYPLWKIRRPGVSLALRSWGLSPGLSFRGRKERGREACAERAPGWRGVPNRDRRKQQVTLAGQTPVSFMAQDQTRSGSLIKRSSGGRHRRTARLWPAWLRRAWPQAEIWTGWTEASCGRARPDALCWGRLGEYETLFWLEVESGHDSRDQLQRKTVRRINQALLFSRRASVGLVFVLLGPRWVRKAAVEDFPALPVDLAVVLEDWKQFGVLASPEWGRVRQIRV
jgi:hypothetical protein